MLHLRLIDSKQAFLVEIINESTVLVVSYIMIGYSIHVGDAQTKHDIGEWHNRIVLTNIGINMLALIVSSVKSYILKCKRRKLKQIKLKK